MTNEYSTPKDVSDALARLENQRFTTLGAHVARILSELLEHQRQQEHVAGHLIALAESMTGIATEYAVLVQMAEQRAYTTGREVARMELGQELLGTPKADEITH